MTVAAKKGGESMEITIKGEANEIADFVLAVQIQKRRTEEIKSLFPENDSIEELVKKYHDGLKHLAIGL